MKRFIFLSFLISLVFISCSYVGGKRIRGNGKIKTETRTPGPFSSIDVNGSFEVYVKQDSAASVTIETDENLLEYVHITTEDGVLNIREERGFNLRSSKGLKIYVNAPLFKHFEATGACSIYSSNKISNTEQIGINLTGASNGRLEVNTPKVNVDLNGASNLTVRGETKTLSADGSGASGLHGFDLMAEEAKIDLTGASDAEVFASIKLDVHVSGAADVKYKGNATVNQSVSGAGSVKKVDTP